VAQAELARLVAEVNDGKHRVTEGTVAHLLDRWLGFIGDDHSPHTIKRYNTIIRNHILPSLGSLRLHRLRPSHLNDLYAKMRSQGYAPNTIRQTHAVIRRALEHGVEEDWLAANPAARVRAPRAVKSDVSPPTVDEVNRLLDAAEHEDPELGAFLRLAAVTGARRGELCALRWADVDLTAGTVLFFRSVVDIDQIKDTKTHQARRIAMGASTVDFLRRHRQAMDTRAAAIGCNLEKHAFLFSSYPACTRPWHPDSVTHWFRRLCASLALKHVRLHDLRHAHATQLLAAGVDVRTVAGRLGHSTASTTLGVYAHFLPQKDRQAAELMEDLLEATPGVTS
jgi:integrase